MAELTRGIKLWSHKYADLGYATTGTLLEWNPEKNKKIPTPKWKWQDATLENYDKYYFSTDNGIMLLTGSDNDIIAIDIDQLKPEDTKRGVIDGSIVFHELIKNLPENTPVQSTPSGGKHYLFSLSKSIDLGLIFNKSVSKLKYNDKHTTIDCKIEGGCVYVYPTKYLKEENLLRYKWDKNNKIVPKKDLPACPSDLIHFLNEQQSNNKSIVHNKVKAVNMNNEIIESIDDEIFIDRTIKDVALNLKSPIAKTYPRKNGYDVKLEQINKCQLCGGTHTSNNYMVRCIVRWIYYLKNYSDTCKGKSFNWEKDPLISRIIEMPTTDSPYYDLMKAYWSLQNIEIVHTQKKRFLCFQGHTWIDLSVYDITREIDCKCISILDLLIKNISYDSSDKGMEKKYMALKRGREYLCRIGNIKSIVERFRSCNTDMKIEGLINKNPDILAVKNGVVELKTGKLRPGRIDDYMTNVVDYNYEGLDNKCDIIEDFMNDIFNNDKELIEYVQKLFGYGITGHAREQKWCIFTGSGSNGKSLLMSLVKNLMDSWYVVAPYEIFFKTKKSSGGATPHLTALINSRFVCKEEREEEDELNIETIKMITGESPVTGRKLYVNDYDEYLPTCLPILLCNNKPDINVNDDASLRRIVVVPFVNVYTTPEDNKQPYDPTNKYHKIKDINKKDLLLSREAQEQLLTWLIRGSILWYKETLKKQPEKVTKAFTSYISENDYLKQFIDECCDTTDPKANVSITGFIKSLKKEKDISIKQGELKKLMNDRGFTIKISNGYSLYTGINVKAAYLFHE